MRAHFLGCLALGGLLAACGSTSDLGGFETSPAGVGGGPAGGGSSASARGGSPIAVAGAYPVGGSPGVGCIVGSPCSPASSFCTNGNMTCQCINGAWGLCGTIISNTGGTWGASTGGRASGGTPSGGRATGGRATGGTPTGGRATGGTGGGPTLAENCGRVCAMVAAAPALAACAYDASNCAQYCTEYTDPDLFGGTAEFPPMVACLAGTTASQWECSTGLGDLNFGAIPLSTTSCESLVCRWSCADYYGIVIVGDDTVMARCGCF